MNTFGNKFDEEQPMTIPLEPSSAKRKMKALVKSETKRYLAKGGIIDRIVIEHIVPYGKVLETRNSQRWYSVEYWV